MKKMILLMLLACNLMPNIQDGKLTLGSNQVMAQMMGEEQEVTVCSGGIQTYDQGTSNGIHSWLECAHSTVDCTTGEVLSENDCVLNSEIVPPPPGDGDEGGDGDNPGDGDGPGGGGGNPCTTCSPTGGTCPCITYPAGRPSNGLLRNIDGTMIRSVGYQSAAFVPYLPGGVITGISLQSRYDWIYAPDGTQLMVQTVTDAKQGLNSIPFDNFAFNCLGWALTDGKYIIDAVADIVTINKLLGIPNVTSAISSNTITVDQNCTGIAVGQILLILGTTNQYVHAAIYEGNGMYSTKNGMGMGTTGVEHMTLQQIKNIYYTTGAGGSQSAFINAPGKVSSSSTIGVGNNGFGDQNTITAATQSNCACP